MKKLAIVVVMILAACGGPDAPCIASMSVHPAADGGHQEMWFDAHGGLLAWCSVSSDSAARTCAPSPGSLAWCRH